MPNIGPLELAVVLIIVLLIFGPKRLPGLGKQVGTGMREFKDSIAGKDKDSEQDEVAEAAPPADASAPALAPAPVQDVAPAPVQDVAPAPVQDVAPAPVQDVAPAPDSTKEAEEQVFGRRD